MTNVIDRQTVIISVNLLALNPSQVSIPINLRFAADELVVKSLSYNDTSNVDTSDVVQIWCDRTNDGLICSFPNGANATLGAGTPVTQTHNEHFRIGNSFQNGNLLLQFLQTTSGNPASYNPQGFISVHATTNGTVVLTIEFLKLKNKDVY